MHGLHHRVTCHPWVEVWGTGFWRIIRVCKSHPDWTSVEGRLDLIDKTCLGKTNVCGTVGQQGAENYKGTPINPGKRETFQKRVGMKNIPENCVYPETEHLLETFDHSWHLSSPPFSKFFFLFPSKYYVSFLISYHPFLFFFSFLLPLPPSILTPSLLKVRLYFKCLSLEMFS